MRLPGASHLLHQDQLARSAERARNLAGHRAIEARSAKANRIRLHSRDEEGSELIEIALVLPIYFMLIFGFMGFAIVLFAYCNSTFAAKAAVRYAVVHSAATMYPCSATDIQNIVNPFLWGAPSSVLITPSWTSSNTVGQIVTVTVKLTYTGLPYLGTPISTTASSQGYIVH
jgi:Flp pilus assembly protein TadG